MEFEPSRVDFRQPNLTKDKKCLVITTPATKTATCLALSVRQAILAAVIALS